MTGKKRIRFFNEINSNDLNIAGGKGANLGEMTQAGFPVPPGFCITTELFGYFLKQNNLTDKINKLSSSINSNTAGEISSRIKKIILDADMPNDIKLEIINSIKKLGIKKFYAVRSSATGEDLPDASFAGQLESYLNVHGENDILEKIKECWVSLFTERAILYRLENKFKQYDLGIAVIVQSMIFSEKSGIMFTADPVTGDRNIISINASFGLGEAVVSGIVSADLYKVDKKKFKILNKNISRKDIAIYSLKGEEGGVKKEEVPDNLKNSQAINDKHIIKLSKLGKRIEEHYAKPQDIEWAIEDDKIYITQSRPMITALPEKIEWNAPEKGLWLHHFRLGEWLGDPP